MKKPRSLDMFRQILLICLTVIASSIPALAASHDQASRAAFLPGEIADDTRLLFATTLKADAPGTEFAAVDLDDDDDLDIVVRNPLLEQHTRIWINDGNGSFSESSTHVPAMPFRLGSWNPTSEEDSDSVIVVEPFNSPVEWISAGLPLPRLSSTEFHSSSSLCALTGFEDSFHLRGPPSPSSI